MDKIALIKAEIEKRILREREVKDRYDSNTSSFVEGSIDALEGLLSFLSTLESEKPMQDGLEEEIARFEDWMETYNQADYPTSFTTRDIARHFAQWGAEHLKK